MQIRLPALFLIATLLFCSTPMREYLNPDPLKINDSTLTKPSSPAAGIDTVSTSSPTSNILFVKDWVGKEFIILEKQNMFKHFGYELTLSETMPDTALETGAQHRLRCDKFCGRTLTVLSVQPQDSEWIVQFTDSLGIKIIGKTHKEAINEAALKSDLESAKKRWLGRAVYSKKGVISTLLEDKTGFGSLKVRIQDPLKVYDVIWGITPLPVNPIWLMVKTSEGKQGFLAVRYSWSNTMSDVITSKNPWDEDLFEKNPESIYSWTLDMWDTVNKHLIVTGMTRDQVLLSWGEPVSIIKNPNSGSIKEFWNYPLHQLLFDDNGLVSVEDSFSKTDN